MHSNYIENIKTTKKHKNISTKILLLVFSIVYGLFVVTMLERHFLLGSGDINSYVLFFDDFDTWTAYNDFSIIGQDIFRYSLFLLREKLNQSTISVLSYLAFITSSIAFYIHAINIRSRKYLIVVLPFFLMIFFTPRVVDLFASGIRSGIAFTILIISIHYLKGVGKYILMILSIIIHLSMLPMISFYFLYSILHNKRINASFLSSFFVLLLWSLIVVMTAKEFYHTAGNNMGFYYSSMIILFGIVMVLTNKQVMKNVYGFISIGLIVVVLMGIYFDFDFRRYIGNSLLFYLLFALNNAGNKTIGIVTISFIPFFLLTNFYTFTNYV